ncbi:hypothetical protein [Priestia koreensis]|uniref:hypothetical protein n=1 Tax=Priestia koreensis TaxID=284581 RepID=UPI00203B3534|nr:hypothetical protein [Priestia koreensis]MCM3005555.1 hypothetical protein [Priestia koreensis]
MKKISLFILLFLLLAGCSSIQHNTDLEKSINSVVRDKSESEINLKKLTTFEWDKAYLITPYSTQKGIEKQLGIDFKDPSNIRMRDDIYLLVFLNKEKVVQYVQMERQGADFLIGERAFLTPSEDAVTIQRH